jgi:hypothetical protein
MLILQAQDVAIGGYTLSLFLPWNAGSIFSTRIRIVKLGRQGFGLGIKGRATLWSACFNVLALIEPKTS